MDFYDVVNNPFTGQGKDDHHGNDLGHAIGTPIPSWDDGQVAYVGRGDELGNFISIQRRDATYMGHAHLLEPSPLHVGDPVSFDQTVGLVGTTGKSDGGHDHATLSTNLFPWSGFWYDPTTHIAGSIAAHNNTQEDNEVKIYEDAGPKGENKDTGTLYVGGPGAWSQWPAGKYRNDRAILAQSFGPIISQFSADIAATREACLRAAPAGKTPEIDYTALAAALKAGGAFELVIAGTARPAGVDA